MFKIGEFSKLIRVPVKKLRFHYEIGLLEPARIDDFTGYRYYTAVKLTHLNQILALKDLGFSLEQIGPMVPDAASADDLSPSANCPAQKWPRWCGEALTTTSPQLTRRLWAGLKPTAIVLSTPTGEFTCVAMVKVLLRPIL